MAKEDGGTPPDWEPFAAPPRVPRAVRKPIGQFSLRYIMVAVSYFAILSWAARWLLATDQAVPRVVLGVLVGLGFAAFGLWAAMRLTRFSFVGWIFFVAGYMAITASTINYLSIPAIPILIGAIIYLGRRRRATEQEALLGILRVAAERGMPLAPGVRALSGQVSGIFAVWTGSLAGLLELGASLPEAIESLPRVVPAGAALLIRIGSESGQLAAGLRQAVEIRSGQAPALRSLGSRVAYLSWIVILGQTVVGFLFYFIMPRFEVIFHDFGFALPELTVLAIKGSHFVIDYAFLFIPAELAVFAYLLVAFLGGRSTNLPVVDRLFPRRHTTLILRALSVVVEAGRPIGPALGSLAERYPARWVRHRLAAAGQYAGQGVGWADALHSCGLLSASDLGVLESAGRAGNLSWALLELAETTERRRAYRLQVWSQVLFVAALLVLGFLVLIVSVAYLAPLTTLIARLAE